MQCQLSEQYRLIGRSLYQLQGNGFVHVALVPPSTQSLKAAIRWFERRDPESR